MVNESFGDLHLKVVDLQQNLSSFRAVVRTRRALELVHHAIRHSIQTISTGYIVYIYHKNSHNNETHLAFRF